MTNELEKQFFDTFNIEPIGCNDNKNCTGALDCTQCPNAKYPQITDRILLELICIWNLYCTHTLIPTDYQKVKEYVLEQFANIDTYKFIVDTPIVKHQVRTLFEEG